MKPQQTRILRIGVASRGRILTERLVREGQAVTLGSAPNCTLQVDDPQLPRRHVLFAPQKGGRYTLALPALASGRLARSEGALELSAEPADAPPLLLEEDDRGKIKIGETTVLFQFVAPPPELMSASRSEYRPRLIDDDDPVFLSFLGLSAALAAAFLVVVVNTPVSEGIATEALQDRFVQLALQPPAEPVEPPEAPETEIDPEGVPEEVTREAPEPEVAEVETPEAPQAEAPAAESPAERDQRLRERLESESLLLSAIGTTGEHHNGSRVADIFGTGDAGLSDLDEALKRVSGAEMATTSKLEARRGHGERGDATIGELHQAEAGGTTVGGGLAANITGTVDAPMDNAVVNEGDRGAIRETIKRYSGDVRACYEKELRMEPTLRGRVEMIWNIQSGQVRSASVFEDTTGSAPLGACIVSRSKLWRFPKTVSGEVIMPFVLSPQE